MENKQDNDVLNPEVVFNKMSYEKQLAVVRWRLILGKDAENHNFSLSNQTLNKLMKGIGDKTKNKYGQQLNDSNSNGDNDQNNDQINTQNQSKKKSSRKGSQTTQNVDQVGIDQDPSRDNSNGPLNKKKGINQFQEIDQTLSLVYQTGGKRSAGLEKSHPNIPKWIENVKKFFPKESKEILEKDLVKKSDISIIFQHPELFEKVEPSLEMVKAILSLKHMMPEKVKDAARKIVKKVVEELKDKIKTQVEKHIVGAIKRDIHTPLKIFRNIDWKQSIRRNLKHYDPKLSKLIMAEPRFFSNEKRKKAWQIIVLVDESGSMADSVIYSVVTAAIFASVSAIVSNLVIFDTQVVDLTPQIHDPVDVLMSVQLGGGTDITQAVNYGRSLIKNPKKAIMIIISDFFEGRAINDLTNALRQVLEGGSKILGLAALGSNAEPYYNREYGKELNKLGIDVLACTPEKLSETIAHLMQ